MERSSNNDADKLHPIPSSCVLYYACFSRTKSIASAHRGLTVLRRSRKNKEDLASVGANRVKVSVNIKSTAVIKTRRWKASDKFNREVEFPKMIIHGIVTFSVSFGDR